MFKKIISSRCHVGLKSKMTAMIVSVFAILMITMILFSQLAMEIYAYAFIAMHTANVEKGDVQNRKINDEQDRKIDDEQNEKDITIRYEKDEHKKNFAIKNENNESVNVKMKNNNTSLYFIKPVYDGTTSSVFGDTISRNAKHLGHDWAVCVGTKVFSSEDGVVENAYYSDTYGYNVVINHGNKIRTRYAHLSKICVKNGEKVSKNQTIGLSGNTGDSTGPHLHFEIIISGHHRNPLDYIR